MDFNPLKIFFSACIGFLHQNIFSLTSAYSFFGLFSKTLNLNQKNITLFIFKIFFDFPFTIGFSSKNQIWTQPYKKELFLEGYDEFAQNDVFCI